MYVQCDECSLVSSAQRNFEDGECSKVLQQLLPPPKMQSTPPFQGHPVQDVRRIKTGPRKAKVIRAQILVARILAEQK